MPGVANGPIVFQSSRAGNPHLFRVEPDGSGLRQLTTTGGNLSPAVSPDGTRIAWVRDGDLWTMAADGSDQRRVTATGAASPPCRTGAGAVAGPFTARPGAPDRWQCGIRFDPRVSAVPLTRGLPA